MIRSRNSLTFRVAALLGGCLSGVLAVSASGASWPGPPAEPSLRISGTVTSSRDGSPIARCRISVTAVTRRETGSDPEAGGRPNGGGGANGIRQGRGRVQAGGDGASIQGFTNGRGGRGGGNNAPEVEPVYADVHGHFMIEVPHAGAWRLSGAARGFRTEAYLQHGNFSTAIVVNDRTRDPQVELRLDPDAVLSGNVFDEAGEPVASAQVIAQRASEPLTPSEPVRWQQSGFAQTDDRGHYELASLGSGSYRLLVQARPWYASSGNGQNIIRNLEQTVPPPPSPDPSLDVVYAPTWFPGATDPQGAQILALHPGEDRQLDFHLLAIPAFHLSIPRIAPSPSAPEGRPQSIPQVTREGGGGPAFTQTASFRTGVGGAWDVGGLSPGTYQVRMPASGDAPQQLLQVTIAPGSATVVTLDGAQPSLAVSVAADGASLDEVGQISFTDTTTGQQFSDGNRGRAFRRGGSAPNDDTDEAEEVKPRTVQIPPGEYVVAASLAPDLYLAGLTATGAELRGRNIRLSSGQPKLTLHLARGRASLSGTVQHAGKPVVGAMILLVPASLGEPGSLAEPRRAQSETDGSFAMDAVLPGPYLLLALDGGWQVNWRDPATLAKYLTAATPLDLHSAATVTQNVEATLP